MMAVSSGLGDVPKHKVMVVGKTGAGKSSFCNFLLGHETFLTSFGLEAVPGRAGADSVTIAGRELYLIDTPGFGDTVSMREDDTVIEEMAKGLQLAVQDGDPGVDMIAYVISTSERYTAEDQAAPAAIDDGRFWLYVLVVFTKADCLGHGDKRQYIRDLLDRPNCPEGLKSLMSHVEGRFMILNSTSTDRGYHEEQRQIFMANLRSLNVRNSGERYTHQLFVDIVRRKCDHLRIQNKSQMEVNKILREQNEGMATSYEEQIAELEATIKSLRETIKRMGTPKKARCTFL